MQQQHPATTQQQQHLASTHPSAVHGCSWVQAASRHPNPVRSQPFLPTPQPPQPPCQPTLTPCPSLQPHPLQSLKTHPGEATNKSCGERRVPNSQCELLVESGSFWVCRGQSGRCANVFAVPLPQDSCTLWWRAMGVCGRRPVVPCLTGVLPNTSGDTGPQHRHAVIAMSGACQASQIQMHDAQSSKCKCLLMQYSALVGQLMDCGRERNLCLMS